MRTIGYRLFVGAFAALLTCNAATAAPPELQRGINITHWFRFPAVSNPAALGNYLDDAALQALKLAGFDFVRLPVQPEFASEPDAIVTAVHRLERYGFKVIIALHPDNWHLETDAAQREALLTIWRSLAAALRHTDPARTLPEVLNEPVFADDPAAWARLQHRALTTIRTAMPTNTVVLTGADWGSVHGLLALPPEADANVIYSFHLYDPAELTALGAYRAGLDRAAMARLPFPADDPLQCKAVADTTSDAPTAALIRFYCEQEWNSARVTGQIDAAADWAQRNHAVVIAGEFGASRRLNAAARTAWLATVRTACERWHVGWALWGYDDSMGFDLHPPPKGTLDPDLLRALGLPTEIMPK